jgi:hypothetical protein
MRRPPPAIAGDEQFLALRSAGRRVDASHACYHKERIRAGPDAILQGLGMKPQQS